MVYRGRVANGVVVFEPGVELPDGTAVEVMPVRSALESDAGDAVYRLGEFAVETGIPDLSLNIDHYLYGHPKVRDAGE